MAERKIVYKIDNVTEYGKLMAYCIEHDISVWRTYWDEREAGYRCYQINFAEKRCYYSDERYYIEQGYTIVKPKFEMGSYGKYILTEGKIE